MPDICHLYSLFIYPIFTNTGLALGLSGIKDELDALSMDKINSVRQVVGQLLCIVLPFDQGTPLMFALPYSSDEMVEILLRTEAINLNGYPGDSTRSRLQYTKEDISW